jgi:aspartate-semialdehyde dehydrogenase
MPIRLGIVGVTGLVGEKIIESLSLLNVKYNYLGVFASKQSKGNIIMINNEEYVIDTFELEYMKDYDYLILAVENDIARKIIEYKKLMKLPTVIIDNSSEYRLDENIPLIVPEINISEINRSQVIANPNCSTTMLVMLLAPLGKLAAIKKVNVSTYQSASGAGKKGLEELLQQTKDYITNEPITVTYWKKQYVFNVFSHNSKITDNYYNQEEMKMVQETKKILNNYQILINPTCVRVPTLTSHCLSVNVEFKSSIEMHQIYEALESFPGLRIEENHFQNSFPEPVETSNKTDIYVGRIRPELNEDEMFNYRSWNFFISGDQLLKGAAYNSVQILKHLITLR